jgi:hypothetical protein
VTERTIEVGSIAVIAVERRLRLAGSRHRKAEASAGAGVEPFEHAAHQVR